MKQSIWTTSSSQPQSFITKGKQRLKQFTDTVYLKNGDEFEIELFNPTHNKVLAKIEMNGNSIGNGIILRPGERVFLERYLDEAKKFLFETYHVNGSDSEVNRAIANNGDIVVRFYNEILSSPFYYGNTGTVTINNPITYTTNTATPYYNNTFTTTSTGTNTFYSNSLTSGTVNDNSLKTIETGRVEKGSISDQSFTFDSSSFHSYAMTTNVWKIKPESIKLKTKDDLVMYCGECGSKRKKDTHKFCPHCGTKF